MTLERDLDLVEYLQGPEQRGVGLHAPVGLPDGRAGADRAVVRDRDGDRERPRAIPERQLAVGPAAVHGGRAEGDAPPDSLEWADGAWSAGENYKTVEDVALYAHGTGALPPGVEGGLDAQTVYRD